MAFGLLELDDRLVSDGRRLGFTGGPDSARAILSSIATSMMTLTALVFSITIVVLQLASGQFSPRVLRTFLHDWRSQATLGVFLATFLFALIVLREVRGRDGATDLFVPGIAVTVCFLFVILSVGFFVQYIHNITTSIRVIEIIDRISTETVGAIDRVHPSDADSTPAAISSLAPTTGTIHSRTRGVVTSVDLAQLSTTAASAEAIVLVVPRVGDFIATGMPLVTVHSNGVGAIDDDEIRKAISLGRERDLSADPAFGFRQMIDIAERALSPGVNDPTTATQCLDHLHDLLRRLAHRPLPPCLTESVEGTVRAVMPQPTWDDYVALALDEIRHWGAGSLQIHQRISSMLDDLAGEVGPERGAVLRERRRLLDARLDDLPAVERPSTVTRRS